MRRTTTLLGSLAGLFLLAAPAAASGSAWKGDAGYRANLVSCILGQKSCRRSALSKDDQDYFRYSERPRRLTRALAEEIADARMTPAPTIRVGAAQLSEWHKRDLEFERYRSEVRALRNGWVPGANLPYEAPPWARVNQIDAW